MAEEKVNLEVFLMNDDKITTSGSPALQTNEVLEVCMYNEFPKDHHDHNNNSLGNMPQIWRPRGFGLQFCPIFVQEE